MRSKDRPDCKKLCRKIRHGNPVVAAGGIATHEDVKHVLDLGVDGVQVATRFIPTEECDADIRLKES